MTFIEKIFDLLKRHPKRIVFPEGDDPVVMKAAEEFARMKLGAPILLGNRDLIRQHAEENGLTLNHVRLIDPTTSTELPAFTERMKKIARYQSMNDEEVEKLIINPNYFAAMMVQYSNADGFVGGNTITTGALLRPLMALIKPLPHMKTLSSCMIFETQNKQIGDHGVLYLADCGIIPEPTVDELADIGLETANLARQMSGLVPRVAYLAFSTKGSAKHKMTEKMAAAAALCKQKAEAIAFKIEVDGELQVDTAIDWEAGQEKAPDSTVAGQANVLIFPDLNAGNIASKLLKSVSGANAYGHMILGLDRPAADISRGSTWEDVLGLAALVGLRAVEYHKLYEDLY
ncbi:MAG: phosphate acyltransferase [Verrucomicrobiota bacterium]|nr:phosphate acyltransferase [Verrucomicrobiota bacterium]